MSGIHQLTLQEVMSNVSDKEGYGYLSFEFGGKHTYI